VSGDLVQEFWDDHVAWSKVAGVLKGRRSFWRSTVFVLTVAGATLQTFAATVPAFKLVAGGIGTVALALVPIFARYFLTAEQTAKWLRARSISEGLKSEIYIYRAGAEPYAGSDSVDVLRAKVRGIRDLGKDLEIERAGAGSPTEPSPPALDGETYISGRVKQQIEEFYRPKARAYAARAEQFRWIEIGFASLAATLSAIATLASGPNAQFIGPWVAVVTTVSGTIAAHAAANRYDFQATTFYATARQLTDLVQDWQIEGKHCSSKEWSDFVHSCEGVISAENRAWMAKLDAS
jgi:hypothetical protein